MSELKCCPFCGGEAKLNYFGDESHIPFYQVSCIECGCKQSNSIHKESVINAWNTRKPMDNIVEKLEELKMRYFLTIANTGDDKNDFAYENVGNALDNAINIAKQEINNGLE